jgi:linoleoyl-CoA desaturase
MHKHSPDDVLIFSEINKRIRLEVPINKGNTRRRLLLKFSFYLICLLATYLTIYKSHSLTFLSLAYILYGFTAVLFAFNFAHDLSHDAVFKSKKKNRLFFVLIYTLVGAHAESWKERHIGSHHFAPNVTGYDTDLKISGLIRVDPYSKRKWYHSAQWLYAPIAYMSYSLFWVFAKDLIVFFSEKRTAKYSISFVGQKLFYLIYILVLPSLFTEIGWWNIFIAFLMMHFSQSLFLLFTFFITHHVESSEYPVIATDGTIQQSWFKNQIISSNDFYPFSRLANFVFGGFNNHIAHHLFPSINHVYYPEVSRIIYDELGKHKITPNETGYFSGIVSHLRLLYVRGQS